MSKKKVKLLIFFIANSWPVAALQSMLYWVPLRDVFTHVEIGLSDEDFNMSAEFKGVIKVDRKKVLEYRKHEIYEVELPKDKIEKAREVIINILAAKYKYDFYFYIRWFCNIMISAVPLFAIAFNFSIYYLLALFLIYVPINLLLKKLAKNAWACAEITCKALYMIGIDFGFSKKYAASSPHVLRLIIMFIAKHSDLKIKKTTGTVAK